MRIVSASKTFDGTFIKRLCLISLVISAGITALLLLLDNQTAARAASNALVLNGHTYTTDSDFDQGTLFNVNHNAPGSHQLQLNTTLSTFPVMWVANAGEDTVSKIDTNTGKELARYRTWFGPSGQPGYFNHLGNAYAGAAPSRTAVDSDGNVYVANRHFDGRPPSVLKILATGGIDRNGNGIIETSSDTNNNGVIDPSEIIAIGDTANSGILDNSELKDERVAWASRLPPSTANTLGRSLSIDVQGNIWVSASGQNAYFKLRSSDGALLGGPFNVAPNYPYGSMVDSNGILWGASLGVTLLKLDTNNPAPSFANGAVQVLNHGAFGGDYGIAIGNGKVYKGGGCGFLQYDPATNAFSRSPCYGQSTSGVAVDSSGNIFLGSFGVQKLSTTGALLWSASANPGTSYGVGIQVDSNGDVWQIDLNANRICKFRGSDGFKLGCFPVGNRPYTYTDATGISRFNSTAASGRWSVVEDGSVAGARWGRVTWNTETEASVPTGASIAVEVRAADSIAGLGSQTFSAVSNGGLFNQLGRYLEVRAILTANSSGDTPVLSDLTIAKANQPPVANAGPEQTVECAGATTPVTLNGSDSSDPDGDSLDFTWSENGNPLSSGSTTTVNLALGEHTITLSTTDPSGETSTDTVIVRVVDTTAPSITSPAAINVGTGDGATSCGKIINDLGGAQASDGCDSAVTVDVTGVPAGNIFPVGTTTITYTATDDSGNSSTATQDVTVTDTTKPTMSCPADVTVVLGCSTATSMPVSFETPTATDNCAGVSVSTDHASGSEFSVGSTVVTATATDTAGNTSSCSFTVRVTYDFTGLFQPVDNLPVVNLVQAGQAIPVKFSLCGYKGMNIFAAGYPASAAYACNGGDPADSIEETVTSGGSALTYDPTTGRYHYVWKTEKSWAGTCRQLVIKLADGSIKRANFQVKK